MDYSLIKALHISAALSSFAFFLLRATWSLRVSPMIQRRWVRVLPHVLDTGLLALGVSLMVMLSAWPQPCAKGGFRCVGGAGLSLYAQRGLQP